MNKLINVALVLAIIVIIAIIAWAISVVPVRYQECESAGGVPHEGLCLKHEALINNNNP